MRIKLGIPLTLNEIAAAAGSTVKQNKRALINYIATDSREASRGDLFIALRGEKYDGALFVDQARENGAYILSSIESSSDIFHPDTRQALLDLAAYYTQKLPYLLYKIGITGSVGKTTTKEFLKILLSQKYITHASEGNFNNEIGLPLSILSARSDTQILLMELGMNSRGEISRMSKCLKPDMAAITNIGSAHIGRLGSREEIAKAKLEILDGMNGGKLIVPKGENLLSNTANTLTFSTSRSDADIFLSEGKSNEIVIYKQGEFFCSSNFSLPEEHYKKCLVTAVSAAINSAILPDKLSHGISLISTDNIRQKHFSAENYNFYDDSYNASSESVTAAVNAFLKKELSGAKSLLLGEILELGELRQQIHFDVGKAIDPSKISRLFLFGEHASEIGYGAESIGFPAERIYLNSNINDPYHTAKQIRRHCVPGEHILVKGSRGVRLERILECFTRGEERREKNE